MSGELLGKLALVPPLPSNATSPGALLRQLREACALTQADIEDASTAGGGRRFERTYLSKVERGGGKGTSDLVRAAFARACHLTRDELADYLNGRATLDQTLALRRARLQGGGVRTGLPRFGEASGWAEVVASAREIRTLSDEDIERVALLPNTAGRDLDPIALADLARDLREFLERDAKSQRRPK